jgi:hypothetical protein
MPAVSYVTKGSDRRAEFKQIQIQIQIQGQ